MTIDAYLAELERRLPRIARRRILAEAQEHLRDSAARHSSEGGLVPHDAEAAAVADFGPVEIVARKLAATGAIRETRIATVVALGAVAFFVVPLYVVPENTLPPAPWQEKPRDIALLQLVSVALWVAAGALALAAAALSWTRWSRLAALPLACAPIALAGSVAFSVVLVVRWFALTPNTPNWALAAPLAAMCLVACAAAALWARSSRRRLVLQD